jgi:hypothetical protein
MQRAEGAGSREQREQRAERAETREQREQGEQREQRPENRESREQGEQRLGSRGFTISWKTSVRPANVDELQLIYQMHVQYQLVMHFTEPSNKMNAIAK